ncbi:hypothetical protein PFISCL1PPCAC_11830, partial [Pristionchus fissidentatus]
VSPSPLLPSFPLMNNSACPNGTLVVGFTPDYFPYLWKRENGEIRGIFTEFFDTISKILGCEGYDVRTYERQRVDGGAIYDGALSRGEVFTSADTTWLRESDPRMYRSTTSVVWTKMVFVESVQSNLIQSSSLSFFLVFPSNILIIIIA